MQALGGVQVVEVRQLGALGVKRSLACGLVGKGRHHKRAAHLHGGGAGTGDAGVALAPLVIVGADQQARCFVPGMQHRGDWRQVACVKGHSHGQAGGLKQTGGGGVTLGHQHHRGTAGHAQQVKVTFFDEALGPEFFVQQPAGALLCCAWCLAWRTAPDDLQAMHLAGHIQHGDDHSARWAEAHAVALHAFALEVFAVALLGAFLPGSRGLASGAVGVYLAGGFGLALVFGQALAQAALLLGAEFGFVELDLGGVVDRPTPHAVAAYDQLVAVGQAHLMQVVPAPAL